MLFRPISRTFAVLALLGVGTAAAQTVEQPAVTFKSGVDSSR